MRGDDNVTNFPLSWPVGRPRSVNRSRALFRRASRALTIADACRRLSLELERIGVREVVISTNVRPRLTGLPSGKPEPSDPGVAIYFRRKDRPYCLACDRWDRVADNIAAIAAEIEANRGRERWGVVSLEEAFEGFVPKLAPKPQWWQVLGLASPNVTRAELRKWFLEMARHNHPDRGGDPSKMAEQSAAYEEGLKALEQGAA